MQIHIQTHAHKHAKTHTITIFTSYTRNGVYDMLVVYTIYMFSYVHIYQVY